MESYIYHSINACQDFTGTDKLSRHAKPEDIRGETNMHFGAEPVDNEEEKASEDVYGVHSLLDILNVR